jgi:probable HAF family extracellular repeat protein
VLRRSERKCTSRPQILRLYKENMSLYKRSTAIGLERFFAGKTLGLAARALVAASALLAVPCVATAQPLRYTLIDLGGGTYGAAYGLNNYGVVAGEETQPDGTYHAVLWYMALGLKVDFGTPGLNSGAFGVNDLGQVEIVAESSTKDPNNEDFCAYGDHFECHPFLWQGGTMASLPLLGGNNGSTGQLNNKGEMPGIAETATWDTSCPTAVTAGGSGPQFLDYEAVVWGPAPGAMRKLSPLPGDTVGMAYWINDNSQAVGVSGTCGNSVLYPGYGSHAVLWGADGSVTDLGNLGGTVVNAGVAINNQGQVTGASSLNANSTPYNATDAFLWTSGAGMSDLGTLSGDVASVGQGINDAGEVVGLSLDAKGDTRAFLWQNGAMTDLNTLIPAGSPLFLLYAGNINSNGAIVGYGATAKGDIHAFLALPSTGGDDNETASSRAANRPMVLSDEVRKLIRQRVGPIPLGGRFAGPR